MESDNGITVITILTHIHGVMPSGLFAFLCLVGILANLKDAKVHWVIEISNVICQLSVAVAAILLFLKRITLEFALIPKA